MAMGQRPLTMVLKARYTVFTAHHIRGMVLFSQRMAMPFTIRQTVEAEELPSMRGERVRGGEIRAEKQLGIWTAEGVPSRETGVGCDVRHA